MSAAPEGEFSVAARLPPGRLRSACSAGPAASTPSPLSPTGASGLTTPPASRTSSTPAARSQLAGAQLVVAVQPAAGHPGQVDGGRAGAADVAHARQDLDQRARLAGAHLAEYEKPVPIRLRGRSAASEHRDRAPVEAAPPPRTAVNVSPRRDCARRRRRRRRRPRRRPTPPTPAGRTGSWWCRRAGRPPTEARWRRRPARPPRPARVVGPALGDQRADQRLGVAVGVRDHVGGAALALDAGGRARNRSSSSRAGGAGRLHGDLEQRCGRRSAASRQCSESCSVPTRGRFGEHPANCWIFGSRTCMLPACARCSIGCSAAAVSAGSPRSSSCATGPSWTRAPRRPPAWPTTCARVGRPPYHGAWRGSTTPA